MAPRLGTLLLLVAVTSLLLVVPQCLSAPTTPNAGHHATSKVHKEEEEGKPTNSLVHLGYSAVLVYCYTIAFLAGCAVMHFVLCGMKGCNCTDECAGSDKKSKMSGKVGGKSAKRSTKSKKSKSAK